MAPLIFNLSEDFKLFNEYSSGMHAEVYLKCEPRLCMVQIDVGLTLRASFCNHLLSERGQFALAKGRLNYP